MKRLAVSVLLAAALIGPKPADAARYYDPDAPACHKLASQARRLGWPTRELSELRRVSARESLCSFTAWNPRDPYGGSFCALQLNGSWRGAFRRAGLIRSEMTELYRPRTCLRAGLFVFQLYGWTPWKGSSS